MAYESIFKRYETKYLLTASQKAAVMAVIGEHMTPDAYGKTTVRNLYYDTDSYRLIRRSLEKPVYKEKLRLRSYAQATQDSVVFVELKKKFDSVVYKRRLDLTEKTAASWLSGCIPCPKPGQIGREVEYFLRYYEGLVPKVFLSYDREAFYSKLDHGFRVTFDENILCRQDTLSLEAEIFGTPILPPGMTLMEIKSMGGIPLWLTRVLTAEKIHKTSFSKYGTAYETLIYPTLTKEVKTNA